MSRCGKPPEVGVYKTPFPTISWSCPLSIYDRESLIFNFEPDSISLKPHMNPLFVTALPKSIDSKTVYRFYNIS